MYRSRLAPPTLRAAIVLGVAGLLLAASTRGALAQSASVASSGDVAPSAFIDLKMAKSHTGNFVVGRNGVYRLAVSNVGTAPTSGPITVTDNLPTGLSFVSGTGSSWTCSAAGTAVTCIRTTALAVGASSTITLTVGVGPAAVGTVTNVATVSTPGDATPGNDTSSDPTTVFPIDPFIDLLMAKSDGGSTFTVGVNGTYTLTVTNIGGRATNGAITVTDALPVGLGFVSASGWSCTPAGQIVTCVVPGPLGPSQSASISLVVSVSPAAVPRVSNTAVVATPNESPSERGNNSATEQTPVDLRDLAIAKSHTGRFTVGLNGVYSVTVSNVGNVPTTGPISVVDNLPAGLTFVSATGPGWSCSAVGAVVSCNNPGPLAAGASSLITLTVAVSATALPSVVNVATVSTPGDAVPGNNTASDPTGVDALLDLAILKTATSTFTVGQNATYSLAVSNVSLAPTTGTTTITDVLPAGLTFVSAAGTGWSCSFATGTVTCSNPAVIAPGATSTVTLTVAVGLAAAPSVTNTGSVQTPGDTTPGNNTSTVTTAVGTTLDLAIAKSHTGNFTVGLAGVYSLTVSNVGNVPTTGTISVVDNLPAGLTFLSATGPGWSCSAVGAVVSCNNPGPLAPGASSLITLTVAVAAAASPSVTNAATVSTPGDVVPGNNTASDPTTVVIPPDLAIVKTATSTFIVGLNATYSLAVNNVSVSPTTGITTITDVLPIGLTFVSASGPGWSCSFASGTVSCSTAAVIVPGASSVVTLTVAVGPGAAPSVTNTGTVKTPGDLNVGNDTSTVVTQTGRATRDLAIAKSHSGNFTVGQDGVYTLTVSNVGNVSTIGPITVVDSLPSGLNFVSTTAPGWTCSAAGAVVSCNNSGVLSPGGSLVITLTVSVSAAAVPSVTNVATVSTPGDAVAGNNTASDPTTVVTPPNFLDLAIVKTATSQFVVGQNATYSLAVSNVSLVPTIGTTTITDVLAAGLTFVSATGPGWSCGVAAGTVTCSNPAVIAPGVTTVVTLTVAVGAAAAPSVTNTGTVQTPGDQNAGNNSSTITTRTGGGGGSSLDLEIVKTASALVAGTTGTYTLTVKNVGGTATTGLITVTDNLPAGLTFISGSGGSFTCSALAQLVTCSRSAVLQSGQSASIVVTVSVTAAAGTVVTNTGVAKTLGDGNPANDSSATISTVGGGGPAPDLAMKKLLVGSAVAGQNATFTLTVTNVGSGRTTGLITVTDVLPADFTYVSATGNGWTCSAVGQSLTCTNAGPLLPGNSTVITVIARAAAGLRAFSNTAVVKTPGDSNPTNDSDTISLGAPSILFIDLVTIKSASSSSFTVGQPASYTLTVRNIGSQSTVLPIVVTDVVPAGLTLVSASGPGWSCTIAGQTATCTSPGPLAPGESSNVTVNVVPVATAVPSVRNTASSTTPGDGNPANDSSTVTTPVGGLVDLSLSKVSVGTFKVGGQGRYTLTVRNTGTNAATPPITVRDTLPTGLTFVSATGTGWACSAVGGIVTCTRSTAVASGESSIIDLTVSLGAAAIPQVTNCAVVTGTNETEARVNNRACDTTPVTGEPQLEISKGVSKGEAQIGDVLDYTLVVRNTGSADLADAVVIDDLPLGFAYDLKTARLGGVAIAEPTGAPGPRLSFAIGLLRVSVPVTVTYRVRIGASAQLGNNTNVAVASSRDGSKKSPPARATTRVSGGLFSERGAIVGKVYTQCNCASAMQETGEVGIPGVRVYLEDGSSAVTDVEGKYSFYGVSARMHVVKVDRASLPRGAVMVALGNRNALDGYSRFADVKGGELHKADFAEGSGSADVLRLALTRRRAGEVENAGTQIPDNARPPRLAGAGGVAQVDARGNALGATAPGDSIRIAYASPTEAVMLSQDSGTGPMRKDKAYRPLLGAANALTDRNSQLPATPLRALAAQQDRYPRGSGRVQLEVPQEGIPADGQTLVTVVVRAVDRNGNPLTGRIPVTLETSLGRWLGDEIGATEQGRQVTLDGGAGSYTLVAAAQPGRGEVRVTTPEGVQTMPITFVPVARPLMAMGLLNARIDFRSLIKGGNALSSTADGFEESLRDWTFDNDSGKVRGGARGALLLKGRVLNDQLLTLSYDSERDRGRTLFRDIRPDEFFPVYGDASMREFDAQSRRKFYARLDRGPSYTMFGDFQTMRADERRVLTAYDRSLNGAVEHFEGSKGTATLFASQGRMRQTVDELPGRGISGPYVLSQSQGLVNSERVEIITRDRNQLSVILSRVVLTRFADYTIEALTGRLLFRSPVPSADANLNPVSIRVTYETDTATGDNFWVYGGDASLRLTDALEVGATYAKDKNPLQNTQLAGVNATAKLGRETIVFGELAQSEQAGTKGEAFRVELRHQSERVDGRVFAARSDSAFSNQSSTFFGGRTELGTRFTVALNNKTRLVGEALRTENNTGLDGRRDGALLSFERQINKAWRAEFGYRYAKESGNYSPYPGATSSLINRGLVDNDVSAIRGRLNWTLPEKTRSSLFTEYEQDIRDDSHRGAVGGEYIINNRTRVYGRHEWLTGTQGPYATNQGSNQEFTVFGIDADYLKNTQMFSEYRARDAFAGRDAEASIGLRNRWAVAPGLLINTSFERVSPLFGTIGTGVNATTGDALAATGAVEWTRPSLWKSTARLEYRDADTGDNFLASFGYARKLSRDWTLLGRTLWDVYDAQQNQTHGWSQLGFAWRETDRNKWNALMRYENRVTHLGSLGTVQQTENLAHILAALVNYQPASRVTLSGRYAAKVARDDIGTLSTRTTSQLVMGRGIFDLNRRLDAGLIGSLLASDGFSSRRYGLGGELGLIVLKNLRVAGGYNLFGFTDKDLNTFGTTRKGAYLELGFKFDESMFGLGVGDVPCDNACRAGGKKE